MKARWTSFLALVLAPGLARAAMAQDLESERIARRDAKLAEPWLQHADWITDYDKALAASKKSGQPIFAYFTRSYDP